MADDKSAYVPTAIIEWELEHGIVRYQKNGMTYVCCTDWQRFMEQTEREEKEKWRKRMNAETAEQQAKAMFGG